MIATVRIPSGRLGRHARRTVGSTLAEPVHTTTSDGVQLTGIRLAGPTGRTFVIGHGMSHSTAERSTRQVIDRLAGHGTVIALDFRGHGGSGGRSSVGGDEIHDLDAAVALARSLSDAPVVAVGFSMGGSVVLRQAALGVHRPDAVIAVSAPSRWYIRESSPMRRVHWLLEHPLGPLVGRWAGIRLGKPWDEVPPSPLETIGGIEAPLLLVHGTADPYLAPSHAIDLQRACAGRAELWLEPGMGHAESGTSAELIDRIAGWAIDVIGAADQR